MGLEASASPLAAHAVVVHSRPRDVASLPGVADGTAHVQDPAQQWRCAAGPESVCCRVPTTSESTRLSPFRSVHGSASLLAPLREGEVLLDACAAPGGKTRAVLRHGAHAASRVVALDRAPHKCEALRRLLCAARWPKPARRTPAQHAPLATRAASDALSADAVRPMLFGRCYSPDAVRPMLFARCCSPDAVRPRRTHRRTALRFSDPVARRWAQGVRLACRRCLWRRRRACRLVGRCAVRRDHRRRAVLRHRHHAQPPRGESAPGAH
eukprot:7379184-Prymnesium_polylepis.1